MTGDFSYSMKKMFLPMRALTDAFRSHGFEVVMNPDYTPKRYIKDLTRGVKYPLFSAREVLLDKDFMGVIVRYWPLGRPKYVPWSRQGEKNLLAIMLAGAICGIKYGDNL